MSGTVGSYGSPLKYFAAAADSSSSSAMWPCVSACTWVWTSIATRLSRSSRRLIPGSSPTPPPSVDLSSARTRRDDDKSTVEATCGRRTGCTTRISHDSAVPVSHRRPSELRGRDDSNPTPAGAEACSDRHGGDVAGDLERCAGGRDDLVDGDARRGLDQGEPVAGDV